MLLLNKIELQKKYKDYLDLACDLDMEEKNLTHKNRKYNHILDDDVIECPQGIKEKLDPQYYLDVEVALLQLIFLGEQTQITGAGKIVIALMINGLKHKHYYWTSDELVKEYKSSTGGVVIHEKSVKNELEKSDFFVSDDGSSYYLGFRELKQAIGLKD